MSIATASATSTAPASAFFARWSDCDTWPEWNTDTAWVRLDGPFTEGATGTLKPRGGPKVAFTVARLTANEFVDVSRMPGGRITFAHRIDETADGTAISVTVDIEGALGWVWRRVLGKGLRSALQSDLDRLVAAAENDVAHAA
ncbi:MAG: SRPBCC family protein [Mycobacteriales bacterium]